MRQRIRGIVFDKDGTLFDFHATWSAWFDGLIHEIGRAIRRGPQALAEALEFDLRPPLRQVQRDDRRHDGGLHRRGDRRSFPISTRRRSAG